VKGFNNMKYIKIGIIGVGNMGSAHLHCIYRSEVEGLKVTSICDICEEQLQRIAVIHPELATYVDYEEMLQQADIDAVLIATPHPLHAKIAIDALKKNKHVLLEKPIDISVFQAKKLNEEATFQDKVFGIMYNQRTNLLFQRARELVQNGSLGELKRTTWIITNWYRTQHYYDSGYWRATWAGEGGGVLVNQAPHNLDLWQWICGMPESVTAFCNVAKYHNIEVEDEAILHTTYQNGATGVFVTSTGEAPGTNRLEVVGTRGKMVIEDGILKHWRLKEDEREVCFHATTEYYHIESDYSEYKAPAETGHKGILQNFTNAILYGEELLAKGAEGVNELTISNAAYLSQWKGNQKITLPLDAEEFDSILREKMANSVIAEEHQTRVVDDYSSRWEVKW